MSLTIVIPVHNDEDNLLRLLRDIHALGCIDAIIVVDDGSRSPLRHADLVEASSVTGLSLLRNTHPQGPGPARNRALQQVKTPLVLFLDADDQPTRSLAWLIQDLKGKSFDFCLFQHHDTRMDDQGVLGQMPYDQRQWDQARLPPGALAPVQSFAAAHLVQTSNYPWNKIYNTGFLQRHDIRCSEILVHEDIELHWRSFFKAQTILASDHIAVIHHVQDSGTRLTNRTGTERLEVFAPLTKLLQEIERDKHPLYLPPFLSFCGKLLNWISHNLDPSLQETLAARTHAFITEHVPADRQEGMLNDCKIVPKAGR